MNDVLSTTLSMERVDSNHYKSRASETMFSNRNFVIPIEDTTIYTLQTIQVHGNRFTIFYDIGRSELVTRFKAVEKLGKRAAQEYKGPISIDGVGDLKIDSYRGIYTTSGYHFTMEEMQFYKVCLDHISPQRVQFMVE